MEETAQGRQMRGRFMSNYGLKTDTPEQIKEQWRENEYEGTGEFLFELNRSNCLTWSLLLVK